MGIPCLKISQVMSADAISIAVDKAGTERFLNRVALFQADLARTGAGQALYKGIMGALGYSKNKLAFLELARRVPLQMLELAMKGRIAGEECLIRQQALLLGTAGWLPSQRQIINREGRSADKYIDELERIWASYQPIEAMSFDAWHRFKVRPENSPLRRMVAMSYLTYRYRKSGILEELVRLVKDAPASRGYRHLEEGLLVSTNDYWANHSDFGPDNRIRSSALLGRGRAADIIINVLLPFTFAWSNGTLQSEIGSKIFDLYCHYPRRVTNSLEKHMMAQLGLNNRLVNSARRQQGLIHIYNTLCTQGRCSECRLSQPEARDHIHI